MQTLSTPHPVTTRTASIVIVDSDRLVVESFPQAVSSVAHVRFLGRAREIEDGLDIAQAMMPDLILSDSTSFRAGFRRLAEFLPIRIKQMKLALFADRLSDTELERALAIPAMGLLSKQDSLSEVGQMLIAVAEGERVISSSLRDRFEEELDTGRIHVRRREQLGQLSNLQLEVLVNLANGLRVREIARLMHLSPKAIESHKYRIMQRLDVHDRLGLCRWAIREGLIEP